MRTGIIALGMGIALVAAACGGGATGSGNAGAGAVATGPGESAGPVNSGSAPVEVPAAASVEPSAGASPSDAPTSVESPSTAADGGPDVSLAPGAVPDLEAMLPDEAGGIRFNKGSVSGDQLASAGIPVDDAKLTPILAANGKTISDLRLAMATPSESTAATVMVVAFQVKGLDATSLLPILGDGSADFTPKTIGGKAALVGGAGTFLIVAYPHDDILFYILLGDEKTVTDILEQLP